MTDINTGPTELRSQLSEPMPQFATAEYAGTPGTERCRICTAFITGEYYRVNNEIACANCAQQAMVGQPTDSHAAFLRGLLLASAGALAGLILYASVAIATGWTIGYVALAVGWLVGKGFIKGSNGLGGRRYQIAAVMLTYAAISMAAVPIGISYAMKNRPAKVSQTTTTNPAPGEDASSDASQPSQPAAKIHLGSLIGELLFVGLASPFLEFKASVGGAAIGLFILFIGLRIAWTLTRARPLGVDGPYPVTSL